MLKKISFQLALSANRAVYNLKNLEVVNKILFSKMCFISVKINFINKLTWPQKYRYFFYYLSSALWNKALFQKLQHFVYLDKEEVYSKGAEWPGQPHVLVLGIYLWYTHKAFMLSQDLLLDVLVLHERNWQEFTQSRQISKLVKATSQNST